MQDVLDEIPEDFQLSIFERLTLASMAMNKVLEDGENLDKSEILQKFESINTVFKSVIAEIVNSQANDFGDVAPNN